MAQSGYTPILIYASGTTTNVPLAANLTSSASGAELALNYVDGKLFYKDNAGVVQTLATKSSTSGVFTSVTDSGLTSGRVTYATTGGLLTDSANLTFNGTTLTANTLNLTNALGTTYGGTGLGSYTAGDLTYYSSGTAFSKLAIGTSGQILTSTGSAPQWSTLSGVAVTTFSAGTTGFTPSSATSGAVTLAGTLATTNGGTGLTSFTANGVVYASSSSALATGSALTFNGSNFKLTGSDNNNLVYSANSNGTTSIRMQSNAAGNYLVAAGADPLYFQNASASGVMVFAPASSTEQMRLTSTGLGIGTSSPSNPLHVIGSILTSNTSGNAYLQALSTNNGSSAYFRSTANTIGGTAQTWYVGQNLSGNAGAFEIYDSALGGDLLNSPAGSGNLGLGVTPIAWGSSHTAFQVGARAALWAEKSAGNTYLSNNTFYDGTSYKYIGTAAASQYTQNAGSHLWLTAPSGTAGNAITFTQAMTLDSSGRLGIGTSSPTSTLTVAGTITAISGITPAYVGYVPTGAGVFVSPTVNAASNSSAPNAAETVLTLTRSGVTGQVYPSVAEFQISKTTTDLYGSTKLGIKLLSTDNVSFITPLTLSASAAGSSVAVTGTLSATGTSTLAAVNASASCSIINGGGNQSNLRIGNAVPVTLDVGVYNPYFTIAAGVLTTATNHPLIFGTNNTEVGRFDTSGNLGIGTSSPSGKLTVANTYTNTSDATIVASSSIPGINLRTTSTGRFSIFSSYSANNSTSFVVGTGTNNPSSESIFIDHTTANVRFANAISVGGVTPAASGAGITFPATQSASSDANTLDDYEEGTWTPTDASGAGLTFTVSFAKYTKVGRAVSIQGAITYPTTASTVTAQFTGFPFNAVDSIQMSLIYTDASVATFTYLSGNTTNVYPLIPGVNITNATLSGKLISFAGTYFV